MCAVKHNDENCPCFFLSIICFKIDFKIRIQISSCHVDPKVLFIGQVVLDFCETNLDWVKESSLHLKWFEVKSLKNVVGPEAT